MAAPRPLLRPAVVLERPVLGTCIDGEFAVSRTAALAVGTWRRLGYVCAAVGYEPAAWGGPAQARRELALRQRIDTDLRGAGGGLDGTYVYPRPGERVDADVPRASVFARLVLEAIGKHRLDAPRSLFVAATLDGVEGARIAGVPCGIVVPPGSDLTASFAERPAARPDFVWSDIAAARALVETLRARALESRR